ncbi:MAG TPA: hypothetical protein VKE40_16440 [Gemmataceae bacterium]|nr:hypothetical protein [Gemmataceae bacterium]
MDTRIVADEALLSKVREMTAPTQLCDANGNTVAVVVPPGLYRDLLLTWSDAHFDPEFAERSWQDYLKNGGRSTAEIFELLKNLEEAKDPVS